MVLAILVLSLQLIRWSVIEWHRFANHPALPPPLPRVILASKSRTCGSHLSSNTWKMCGNGLRRGGGGGGVGSPLAGFPSNKEIWFFEDFSEVI